MTNESNDNRVSVVFTVLNDVAGAERLVEALLGQTRLPDEIVIVDGGSADGTFETLAAIDTGAVAYRCLRVAGVNIAEGRNHAIEIAQHELIACTDAGCVPDANWLEELLRLFDDPAVTVVGGNYRVAGHTALERVAGLLTMPGALTPVAPLTFNPSARSIAFRRGAWRRAGGYPNWLYTAEDTLFDCKLREGGEVFEFAEHAIVRWRPRSSLAALRRQFVNYARGEARIGRGDGAARFWRRRYRLSAAVLLLGLMFGWLAVGVWGVWGAVAAAGLLLWAPVHARAAAVARRTHQLLHYPLALFLGHWIALANVRGHRRGRQDRRDHPEVFVERLRGYWGSDAVTRVRPWSMRQPPAPRTLVVSWHWPPANRASTNVLGNLFACASPAAFRVLTRLMPDGGADPLDTPRLRTRRVRWLGAAGDEGGWGTWLASIVATMEMVVAARRIHREVSFERVLAVYPHKYSLLAGYLVSRLLGIPLCAYMHDLFAETSIARQPLKRKFWEAIDRAALGHAQLVAVPTDGFVKHYAQRGITRTWVLPHVMPLGAEAAPLPERCDRVRLVYAGSIYQAHEDAARLLVEATCGRDDVDVVYLTRPNRIVPEAQTRWVTRAESSVEVRRAHAGVVVLGRDTPYPEEIQACFPSKIVDYLAAGRPILAIVPAGCFVEELVRRTGCGVAVTEGTVEAVRRALDVLGDAESRAGMGAAALRLAGELDAAVWMRRLERRLALGSEGEDADCGFPCSEDGGTKATRVADIQLVGTTIS